MNLNKPQLPPITNKWSEDSNRLVILAWLEGDFEIHNKIVHYESDSIRIDLDGRHRFRYWHNAELTYRITYHDDKNNICVLLPTEPANRYFQKYL